MRRKILLQLMPAQMNIQPHKVITHITDVTGIRIIEAILDGERDSIKLAQLKGRQSGVRQREGDQWARSP